MTDTKRIYLEADKLSLIISENQKYIGKPKQSGVEKIISAIAFWIPMAIADFQCWGTIGLVVKIILVISGILYTMYG